MQPPRLAALTTHVNEARLCRLGHHEEQAAARWHVVGVGGWHLQVQRPSPHEALRRRAAPVVVGGVGRQQGRCRGGWWLRAGPIAAGCRTGWPHGATAAARSTLSGSCEGAMRARPPQDAAWGRCQRPESPDRQQLRPGGCKAGAGSCVARLRPHAPTAGHKLTAARPWQRHDRARLPPCAPSRRRTCRKAYLGAGASARRTLSLGPRPLLSTAPLSASIASAAAEARSYLT